MAPVRGRRAGRHSSFLFDVTDTFVNGRGANVVHELAIMVPRFRLCARLPVGLRGYPASPGSCARRVGDVPRGSRYHLSHPDSSTWTRPPRPPCAPASIASSSMEIDWRFMCRLALRVRPRESGCPIRKRQPLDVLVVWAPRRKKRNQEQQTRSNTS